MKADRDIEVASTIPNSLYRDAQACELARERVFARARQGVCAHSTRKEFELDNKWPPPFVESAQSV